MEKKRANVDDYCRNALWYHAADGNYEALDAELRCADSRSAADQYGFTTLHVAAQNGHLDIVRRLIAAHAEVNAVDRHGKGPLWTASRQASLAIAVELSFEIVALLLSNGADPHHLNNAVRSPCFWAAGSSRHRETYTTAGVPLLSGCMYLRDFI
ncbi:hypothetical protein RU07_23930 [Agrobacterium tumefaciens]|uniref:Uncharacterized protein n=1 Tax=Agrobacterium tumefaciens TaxID=358 RepID=A0A0D0IWQ9_AGRTU|nr:hypothetical protein RU07_23930 [Agrobacterium tumefaciens]